MIGDVCKKRNGRKALFDIVELTVFMYPKSGDFKLYR